MAIPIPIPIPTLLANRLYSFFFEKEFMRRNDGKRWEKKEKDGKSWKKKEKERKRKKKKDDHKDS